MFPVRSLSRGGLSMNGCPVYLRPRVILQGPWLGPYGWMEVSMAWYSPPPPPISPAQIKYYKYEKSGDERGIPGTVWGRLSVGTITASGLILLQIKRPGGITRNTQNERIHSNILPSRIDSRVSIFGTEGKWYDTGGIEEITCFKLWSLN